MHKVALLYHCFVWINATRATDKVVRVFSRDINRSKKGRKKIDFFWLVGGGSTLLPLKKVNFFRQNVKNTEHALKNLFC